MPDLRCRYLGCLLGLACGDAVGTAVEFSARGSFPPVTGMLGGGPFSLQPGQWTDDTSMALCLAESLVERQGFDAHDQMVRYLNWWKWGCFSSTGQCFDIGMTVAKALQRFAVTDDPFAGSTDPMAAGNGSLMRLAPVVLYYYPDQPAAIHYAAESSRTTHAAAEAIDCCNLFAQQLLNALSGKEKAAILTDISQQPAESQVQSIASATYLDKTASQITGSGYCVPSLEAALWSFASTDSFEQAILVATNLGDDADTTAAITGQIAGAYYGVKAIPSDWLEKLSMRDDIETLALRLLKKA